MGEASARKETVSLFDLPKSVQQKLDDAPHWVARDMIGIWSRADQAKKLEIQDFFSGKHGPVKVLAALLKFGD